MPDKTVNWGVPGDDARYRTRDDDPAGGGDYVVAETLDANGDPVEVLLRWDDTAGEWVSGGPVNLNGNDVTNVGALDAGSVNTERLSSQTHAVKAVVYEDSGGIVRAIGENGEIASDEYGGATIQTALDVIDSGIVLLKPRRGVSFDQYFTSSPITVSQYSKRLVGEARGTFDGSDRNGVNIGARGNFSGDAVLEIGTGTDIARDCRVENVTIISNGNAPRCLQTNSGNDLAARNVWVQGANQINLHVRDEPGGATGANFEQIKSTGGAPIGVQIDAADVKFDGANVYEFTDTGWIQNGRSVYLNMIQVYNEGDSVNYGMEMRSTADARIVNSTLDADGSNANLLLNADGSFNQGSLTSVVFSATGSNPANQHIELAGSSTNRWTITGAQSDSNNDFINQTGSGSNLIKITGSKLTAQSASFPAGVTAHATENTGAAIPNQGSVGDLSGTTGLFPGMMATDDGTNATGGNPAQCTWTGAEWQDPEGNTFA